MQSFKVGDPMDEDTQMGPLAAKHILDNLERQVQETVRMGARVLTGGHRCQGPATSSSQRCSRCSAGFAGLSRRTIWTRCCSLSRQSFDEALWSWQTIRHLDWARVSGQRIPNEQSRFIDEIESGMAFVNALVASDARLPFGDQNSGFGRELGAYGMREFVNVKTFVVN